MAGKKKKKRRKRNKSQPHGTGSGPLFPPEGMSWMERDGLHALMPGEKPSEAEIRKITEAYQRQIRKSPLFRQWVREFGKKKAREMLKECRFEVR